MLAWLRIAKLFCEIKILERVFGEDLREAVEVKGWCEKLGDILQTTLTTKMNNKIWKKNKTKEKRRNCSLSLAIATNEFPWYRLYSRDLKEPLITSCCFLLVCLQSNQGIFLFPKCLIVHTDTVLNSLRIKKNYYVSTFSFYAGATAPNWGQ